MLSLLKYLPLLLGSAAVAASELPAIELHPLSTGTYSISASMAPAVKHEFLLDTGASMVMLSHKVYKEILKHHKLKSNGKVAAASAGGSVKSVPTYIIPSLMLDNGCDVGPVEVAVIKGASRNLIGLNALEKMGALTLDTKNLSLVATHCPTL